MKKKRKMQENATQDVKLYYIYYTPGKTDCTFTSDRSIVTQILSNLLHNALKFTQRREVELSYGIDNDKKELHLYVRDTGSGVSSELKKQIFERFYKVDSFTQGAGLGLSLCRTLAERLKAHVYLDTAIMKGVYSYLPIRYECIRRWHSGYNSYLQSPPDQIGHSAKYLAIDVTSLILLFSIILLI